MTVTRGIQAAAALALLVSGVVPGNAAEPGRAATASLDGLSIDDRRPDQPVTVDLFGHPVQLTGSWEYKDERRDNFDLDDVRARDRRIHEHEIKLEARTRPTRDTEIFVRAVGLLESRRTLGRPVEHTSTLERDQAWVRIDRLWGSALSLQAGRLSWTERRSFWWDEDLDGIRLSYVGNGWGLRAGVAREFARVSTAQQRIEPDTFGVKHWFGEATWQLARRHRLDAFLLVAQDRSGRDALGELQIDEERLDRNDFDGRWFGVRASGQWRPATGQRISYWSDAAIVRGRETVTTYDEVAAGFTARSHRTRAVRGHAIDAGATLILQGVSLRPSFTAAYARGSGGARSTTVDENFRQTGLQENKARIAGVKRLQRYGELLQPELSNLEIVTLAAGVRMLKRSSLEVLLHRYRQRRASTTLLSRLSADPAGSSTKIGTETDVVLALREWRQFEIVMRYARFRPSTAFAPRERDVAHAVEVGLEYNF